MWAYEYCPSMEAVCEGSWSLKSYELSKKLWEATYAYNHSST
jgi:hypothetical protein